MTNSKTNTDAAAAAKVTTDNYKGGLLAVLAAAGLWGVLPIYWQALRPIPSAVIIFYRIVLVAVVAFLVSFKLYGWEGIKAPLRQKGIKIRFFLAGLTVTINWSIYIWAVNANHVVQTSIGYYIEPLMICLFGVIFFKEKLDGSKKLALGMALIGVLILLVHFKQVPGIALSLAISFAAYSAMKKKFTMAPTLALLYETMFLAPVGIAVIIYLETHSMGAIGVGEPWQYALMLLCGPLTALPLGLFGYGANNVSLVVLGITEYVSPSLSLIIGVLYLKEPFDVVQFYAFAAIWIGLVFFTIGEIRESRRKKAEDNETDQRDVIEERTD